jgi:anti-sigma B factor antagonist
VEPLEPVSIEVEHIDSPPVAVVRVRGELDFGTTPRLVETIAGVPEAGRSVIFDLSELQFCDSSGLGALIATYKTTSAGGGKMYLAGVTATVLTAIQMTTLDRLFPLHDTVEDALAEVDAA